METFYLELNVPRSIPLCEMCWWGSLYLILLASKKKFLRWASHLSISLVLISLVVLCCLCFKICYFMYLHFKCCLFLFSPPPPILPLLCLMSVLSHSPTHSDLTALASLYTGAPASTGPRAMPPNDAQKGNPLLHM